MLSRAIGAIGAIGVLSECYRRSTIELSDHPSGFHGQLEHVRDMLEQAVLRRVLGTPPDGEITLDWKDIGRGYAQFSAAMY